MVFFFPATSLCFAERQIYTQDTLAVVLQTLVEVYPLPTLLMRTVMQALTIYPRLLGFTITLLQRLIQKQVSSSQIQFDRHFFNFINERRRCRGWTFALG